ncbi:unnamed protein product [Moneuplotes crassus]|uniref:Uncharacterized protein n=1 Tax=Euplotes crassus TaxID=5936 RepID=A0AAD1XYV2_EUPCR|nr:unnamed protein product [Moneuplotes crassus]
MIKRPRVSKETKKKLGIKLIKNLSSLSTEKPFIKLTKMEPKEVTPKDLQYLKYTAFLTKKMEGLRNQMIEHLRKLSALKSQIVEIKMKERDYMQVTYNLIILDRRNKSLINTLNEVIKKTKEQIHLLQPKSSPKSPSCRRYQKYF